MTESVRPSNRRLALILGGLAMFGPFSIDTIFPAFPAMGAQLGADKVAMQQTISAYLLTYALMSLVHGPLLDTFGRRRVILGGLFVFLLAAGFWLRFKRGKWKTIEMIPQVPVVVPVAEAAI